MTLRLVEIILPNEHERTLQKAMERLGVSHVWNLKVADERVIYHFVTDAREVQRIVDVAHTLIEHDPDTRVTVLPVELALPRETLEAKESGMTAEHRSRISREELYAQLQRGAHLSVDYMVTVILSTVVAVIGLLSDNVAVLVGAMVIAPFLGPNLAFAFATTMGDRTLGISALTTLISGLAVAIILSMAIGALWPDLPTTTEVASRTAFGIDALVLAVASGGAAVLSITGSTPMSLVGVMVAVALLPPASVVGLKLGVGDWFNAEGAALLLAVNIIGLNLAAKIVFSWKGVTPRQWDKKDAAMQLWWITIVMWLAVLSLVYILAQRHAALLGVMASAVNGSE